MNTKKLFLLIILLVSAFLRLYKLGYYPIHLTNDEAGLGYNAYSILTTARDEHGAFLPVVFKSFGDWKPGLYVYLSVPSIALLGLSEFSVRLPSALFGILAVFLIFKITEKLFNKEIALFSSLSLAIMPWHIHFSRGAWEGNVYVTLLLAGIYFFIKSKDRSVYLMLSAVSFGLSLWAYQSAKLGVLLVLIPLTLFFGRNLLSMPKKTLFVSALIGTLLALPILFSLFSGKAGRISVMSVFSYTRPEEYIEETVFAHESVTKNDLVYKLYHSERLNLARGIAGRYFNYFSARYLFFNGDWSSPRHTATGYGYLHYVDVLFLFTGVVWLAKERFRVNSAFVVLLLAVLPLPSVLTRDSIQGIRSLPMVIPLSIILGFGMYCLYDELIKKRTAFRLVGFIVGVVGIIYSLVIYANAYYVQTPKVEAKDYFYGYKQVISKIWSMDKGYERIVFSQSYDQPYIFFLFYGVVNKNPDFSPAVYWGQKSFIDNLYGDVGLVEKLGKVEFRQINWSADRALPGTLLVGRKTDFPPEEIYNGEYKVETIDYPNTDTAFIIVESK